MTQAAFTTFRQNTVQDFPGVNPHEPFGRRFTFTPNFANIVADINGENGVETVPIFSAISPHRLGLTINTILPGDIAFIQGYCGFPAPADEVAFSSTADLRFPGEPAQNQEFTPRYTTQTVSLVVRNVPVRNLAQDEEGNPIFSPFIPNPIPPFNLDNPQRDNPMNPASPRAEGD